MRIIVPPMGWMGSRMWFNETTQSTAEYTTQGQWSPHWWRQPLARLRGCCSFWKAVSGHHLCKNLLNDHYMKTNGLLRRDLKEGSKKLRVLNLSHWS